MTLQKGVALHSLGAYGATVTFKSGGGGRVMAHLKKEQVSGEEDL